jgi:response regulator NasT
LPTQSPARILTVEDDPIVRADLRLVLEDAGFDVLPDARDGVEAVDHAREHRPDLILIDLGLPRLSGVEATRQILGERDVPIVALTGHRDGELVDEALDAGAVGHVLKPFHDRQLVETLRIALTERGRRNDENERRRQLLLIDSLVRRGYAEAQIIAALEDRDAIG